MPVLTDAPDAVRAALAGTGVPVEPAALNEAERWAWTHLASADRPVRGSHVASSTWPGPIVIVGHAPSSQFVRLQHALADGEAVPDALVALALDGARFRGQRGRAWTTLRGNLHASVHLALDLPAADTQAPLAVLPAVVTARAIERASDGRVRPGLKWVNDLLLDDRKVGGVLAATSVDAGRVRHLLLGIGVNVAALPEVPISPRALPPARLADADPAFAGPDAWGRLVLPLLEEIASAREALRRGEGPELLDAYRARAVFLGRDVVIWPVDAGADARPIAQGRVEALLPDLSLRIAGHATPIRHGRMTLA